MTRSFGDVFKLFQRFFNVFETVFYFQEKHVKAMFFQLCSNVPINYAQLQCPHQDYHRQHTANYSLSQQEQWQGECVPHQPLPYRPSAYRLNMELHWDNLDL